MKLFLIILLILGCFYSCNHRATMHHLTGSNGKYWDIVYMKGIKYKIPGYGYYFNSFGLCYYYYYKNNKEREKFDFEDVHVRNKWSFIGQDTLNIQDFNYRINFLNEDKLILISSLGDTFKLQSSLNK